METINRRLAILILLGGLGVGQDLSGQQTTDRLNVVYRGATPGRIRGFEQDRGNYIDLIWPSSMAANYTVTMPKETATLLATENHSYAAAAGMAFYRANGTEATPTDVSDGNLLFSFFGYARTGGAYANAAGIQYVTATASPLSTQIWFYTSDAGSFGVKALITASGGITAAGNIIPFVTSTQSLGDASYRWQDLYLGGLTPAHFDRPTRTTNQSTVWSVAGSESGTGVWTLGTQPNSTESSFHLSHAGNNRIVVAENGQIDLSGPALNALSANASFSIVNAVGSPAYRVNGTTVIDAGRNASFVNLTLTGTCTGCPAGTPPVDWWLDSGSDVVTLGNHGTVSASQLVTKFSRGTNSSPTNTADTDQVFGLKMQYYADGSYRDSAAIFAYATATPSSSSSPGKLSFLVTPTGSTSGVERFYIDDTEAWFTSSLSGNWLLNIRNNSSSGYSGIGFFSHDNAKSGYIGWNNSASSVNPSTFSIGTRSNDLVAFITQETVRWTLSNTGFMPNTDGGQVLGTVSAKPSEVYSRSFKTYTASGYGTQSSEFVADANLNLLLEAFSSSSATDRASLQFYRYRGSVASPSAVVSGDRLGNIAWQGYTSGGLAVGAVIEAYASGTVSSGVLPTELRMRTTNLSGTLADRWLITNDGSFVPATDDTYFIGIGGQRPSAIVTMDQFIFRDLSFVGGRLASDMLPKADITYDLGSSSLQYSEIYGANIYGGTALYVVTTGVTRFSASGGGVNIYSSGGTNNLSITASTGNLFTNGTVSSVSGYIANGNTGGSGTLTCGAGQAVKNLTFVLGIVVSASCGAP